jgi:hypothetical protein
MALSFITNFFVIVSTLISIAAVKNKIIVLKLELQDTAPLKNK